MGLFGAAGAPGRRAAARRGTKCRQNGRNARTATAKQTGKPESPSRYKPESPKARKHITLSRYTLDAGRPNSDGEQRRYAYIYKSDDGDGDGDDDGKPEKKFALGAFSIDRVKLLPYNRCYQMTKGGVV